MCLCVSGELVPFHVVVHCEQKSEVEKTIVEELNKYIRYTGRTTESEGAFGDLHLVAVQPVGSLLLYFYCESVAEVYKLSQLLECGHLQVIVEDLIRTVTRKSTKISVSIRLHDEKQFVDSYNQLLVGSKLCDSVDCVRIQGKTRLRTCFIM